MKFRYKVGEKVSIKTLPELMRIYGDSYGHPEIPFGWDSPMAAFCGKTAIIAETYDGDGRIGYRMRGNRYTWHEDAVIGFFGVNNLTKGDMDI